MATYPKIIALDLENATIENLEYWFMTTDYIQAEATKNYLRHSITNWKENEEYDILVYCINDFHFAYYNNQNSSEINYSSFVIDELMEINPIILEQIMPYKSVLIDWIFNPDSSRVNTAKALHRLKKTIDHDLFIFSTFIQLVTVLQVEDLGFKLRDFFIPNNDKFNKIVDEFDHYYGSGNHLEAVKLTRIMILDKFILGYSFQMEGETYEHFFYNIELEKQLAQIPKFTFDDKIKLTVDTILEKISQVGIVNLTKEERNFLQNQTL
jgi:hypothetical protein